MRFNNMHILILKMAATWAATILTIILMFHFRKTFASSDSVCFEFYHGITDDTGVSFVYESLFVLQNTKLFV